MDDNLNSLLELKNIHLEEKELFSKAFKAFNTSIEKLRNYQEKLEEKIEKLNSELYIKNQELTNVIESLSSGLIVTDMMGNIQTFNRAATAITGVSSNNATGNHINLLLHNRVLPGLLDEKNLELVSNNFQQEFVFVRETGEKVIIESSTTLIKSDQEEFHGIIVNLNDVTLIKQLQEDAERKNRLTAMGEIAANVAHEIRNPLGSIELFVSLLKMDLKEAPEQFDLLNHITSGVHSMNHIISNLLQYAKPRPVVRDEINIHELLKTFISGFRYMADQQNIEIMDCFNAEEPIIHGDLELIKQVLHNILLNGLQAMPDQGKLIVEVDNLLETDPAQLKLFKEKIIEDRPLKLLSVIIKDSGKGMSEEVKRRIFDPFFTTKTKGTGLGMSIVNNIVESHGGVIKIDSECGVGTTVTLLFKVPVEQKEEGVEENFEEVFF